MTRCPLCAWTMEHVGKAVGDHHLRAHLRADHGLRLAETVLVARRAEPALSPGA